MQASKSKLIPLFAVLSLAGTAFAAPAATAPATPPAAVPAAAAPAVAPATAPVATPEAVAPAPYDPAKDPELDKQMGYIRDAIYTRKAVVLEGMLALTPEQRTAFDPVQKAYDAELKKLGDRRLALIKEYASFYNTRSLDDKHAKRLVMETIKVKQDQLALFKSTFDKAAKAIGVTKAAEFIQVENAFAAAVDTKLALEMPRVGSAMKQ
jgi:hypothetical protein